MADLMNYKTGVLIRTATREEAAESAASAETDGGRGVILVTIKGEPTSCYVEVTVDRNPCNFKKGMTVRALEPTHDECPDKGRREVRPGDLGVVTTVDWYERQGWTLGVQFNGKNDWPGAFVYYDEFDWHEIEPA